MLLKYCVNRFNCVKLILKYFILLQIIAIGNFPLLLYNNGYLLFILMILHVYNSSIHRNNRNNNCNVVSLFQNKFLNSFRLMVQ